MQSVSQSFGGSATDRASVTADDLAAAFTVLTECIVLIDPNGVVQFANPAAERLLGFRHGELVGTFLGLLISTIRAGTETGDTLDGSWAATGKRKDGTPVRLQGSCSELPGKPDAFVLAFHECQPSRDTGPASDSELTAAAFHQIPLPALIVTAEGRPVYANAAFQVLSSGSDSDSFDFELPASDSLALESFGQDLAEALHRSNAETGGHASSNGEYIAPIRNARGETTHYVLIDRPTVCKDATQEELELSEQRFRKVAEMAGEWLWEQDTDGRYTYSSAAVFDILGYRPEEIQGKFYLDVLTPEDRQHWTDQLPLTPNIPLPFHRLTNRYAHRDGHEVFTESTGTPLLDADGKIVKWWGVDHDITERKRIMDALRLRDRAIESAAVGIAILDAGKPGYPLIYANPAFCTLTGYPETALLNRPHPFAPCLASDQACLDSLRTAMEEGSSCSITLLLQRRDGTSFWCDIVISAVHDGTGRTSHFIWILTDVTDEREAAAARRELETARTIQASLLPKSALSADGLEAAGVCLPAGAVGGDYFDYFVTPEGINATIADVSGHNVGAALIMTETRSALRAKTLALRADEHRIGPAHLLNDLNELLFDDLNGAELFITMLYLVYDRVTRRLTYANAGHNPGIVVRTEADHCTLIDAEGLVLGVKRAVQFEEKSLLLKSGDVVLLYTDGVTEARDEHGELFGIERLGALLIEHRHRPIEELIEKLVEAVRTFAAPAGGLVDDTSMVALKVL